MSVGRNRRAVKLDLLDSGSQVVQGEVGMVDMSALDLSSMLVLEAFMVSGSTQSSQCHKTQ